METPGGGLGPEINTSRAAPFLPPGLLTRDQIHAVPDARRDKLVSTIQQTIRQEVAQLDVMPLPMDVEAERTIIAGLLDGSVSHDDLAPLAAEHFSLPCLTDVYRLMVATRERSNLEMSLRRAGNASTAIAELYVLDDYPARPVTQYQQLARRIVEPWRRRALVDTCRIAADLLCIDAIDFDAAVQRLRETVLCARLTPNLNHKGETKMQISKDSQRCLRQMFPTRLTILI